MEGTHDDTHMPDDKYMHNFIEIPEGKTPIGKPRSRLRIILKLISSALTGLIWLRTRTNDFFSRIRE